MYNDYRSRYHDHCGNDVYLEPAEFDGYVRFLIVTHEGPVYLKLYRETAMRLIEDIERQLNWHLAPKEDDDL